MHPRSIRTAPSAGVARASAGHAPSLAGHAPSLAGHAPSLASLAAALLLLLTAACGPEEPGGNGGTNGNGGNGNGNGELLCEGEMPPCDDAMIQELDLQRTVAPGLIDDTPAGEGAFETGIDATAGGFGANPPHAYVYGRFTDDGLEKVEIHDEDALESADWDIAFRRMVIRINGGDSGSGCGEAVQLPSGTDFEDAITIPETGWTTDDFYSASCELTTDQLPGVPLTALSRYYEYPGCVKMTGNVFVLRLGDGRHVKLQVLQYYDTAGQAYCDENESHPPGATSGDVRIRWAWLD
jgi:hypothetical protein